MRCSKFKSTLQDEKAFSSWRVAGHTGLQASLYSPGPGPGAEEMGRAPGQWLASFGDCGHRPERAALFLLIFREVVEGQGPPGEGNGNPLQNSCLKHPMDSAC